MRKAIQALKKTHPTINAGLRLKLGLERARAVRTVDHVPNDLMAGEPVNITEQATIATRATPRTALAFAPGRRKKRPIRSKGDKTR